MSTIVLPDHRLIAKPTVIEQPTVHGIYADGAIIVDGKSMIEVILYVCRREEMTIAHWEIARIHMTRAGFDRSLIMAAAEFLPGQSVH